MEILFSDKELSKEIWKDIEHYEGLYQVSSLGRIKSLRVYTKIINKEVIKTEPIILKQGSDKDGYKLVGLTKNNIRKNKKVHRLVAQYFIPNPENKPTVNHKNKIKYDNRVNNLEWDSYRDNNIKKWLDVDNSSSFTGVCFKKANNNWTAHISLENKQRHLGSFIYEECAHIMYKKAYDNLEKYDGDLLKFRIMLISSIIKEYPNFSIIKRKNKNNKNII